MSEVKVQAKEKVVVDIPKRPSNKNLVVKDWKDDVIYLIQFPRTGSVPSLSSYSLKLETWLRLTNLNYQNVSNNFTHKSERGQVPFVEVNGRQIPDSNTVINEFTKLYEVQIDSHLGEKERADALAYHSLIEDSLAWSMFYFREKDMTFLSKDTGYANALTGIKRIIADVVFIKVLQRKLRNNTIAQGVGRQPEEEVLEGTKKKLKAISTFLGTKKYILGDKVTTLDATAFGLLSQFYYAPLKKELKEYIESDCQNIIEYLNTIKEEYWTDWEECTTKFSLEGNNSNRNFHTLYKNPE